MEQNELKVSTVDEFENKAIRLIEIPGFEPGETLRVKVKRTSLLNLVANKQIPNELLTITMRVLKERDQNGFNIWGLSPDEFRDYTSVINEVCSAVLVEPSYEQIGHLMDDTQKVAIYQYSQYGLRALEKFRFEPGTADPGSNNSPRV